MPRPTPIGAHRPSTDYGCWITVPMVDISNPSAGIGLLIMVEDTDALPKTFGYDKPAPDKLDLWVRYFEYRLEPGRSISLPASRIQVHRGDWREAFREYTKWRKKWWRGRKPPQWLRDAVALMAIFPPHGPWEEVLPAIVKASRQWGGRSSLLLVGKRLRPHLLSYQGRA